MAVTVTYFQRLMPVCCGSQVCCIQCPWHCGRPLSTHISIRDFWTLTGKSGSVFSGVTAPFSWVLVHTSFYLCPARRLLAGTGLCLGRVSPGLWKFCKQIPLAFKVKVPRLGNLLWALELLQQHENFFVIIVLQFVGCLLSGSMMELMATSSKRTYATCHTSQVLLQPEPLSLWQATADPFLCRRHSNTQRKVWLSLLWVLVNIRFCLSLLSVSGGYAVRF